MRAGLVAIDAARYEALAAARDRRDLRVGVDPAARDRIAALQVAQRCAPEFGRAGHGRVAVPQVGVGGDGLGQPGRRRILRLAHRHVDRRQLRIGRDAGEPFVQPPKRGIETRDALVQQWVHRPAPPARQSDARAEPGPVVSTAQHAGNPADREENEVGEHDVRNISDPRRPESVRSRSAAGSSVPEIMRPSTRCGTTQVPSCSHRYANREEQPQ